MSKENDAYAKDGKPDWSTNERLGLCLDITQELDLIRLLLLDPLLDEDSKISITLDILEVVRRDIVERM